VWSRDVTAELNHTCIHAIQTDINQRKTKMKDTKKSIKYNKKSRFTNTRPEYKVSHMPYILFTNQVIVRKVIVNVLLHILHKLYVSRVHSLLMYCTEKR